MAEVERLHGAWKLLSWVRIGADGAVTHPHTEQGSGRLIYAPSGQMCGFLMSPLHVRGEHGDGQPQFVSYSGRYEITGGIANHHVDFASDLRMMSKVLRRRITWLPNGDLKLVTLAAAGAADRDSSHELTWRRDD